MMRAELRPAWLMAALGVAQVPLERSAARHRVGIPLANVMRAARKGRLAASGG
ncbi:hypothetical protein GXW74_03290 [Roseomonas eburnea]|uniref:Uncharacterized protein n=1 Tax=Neoroseomonas eburnea TaxID=1346889 RepID=A0A9X9X710_9PROT|nr:hypothetical protein [Neoroseomonas eburnea]MBR0679496.1 hypothetical protein [Neoroseomonas eburnea]